MAKSKLIRLDNVTTAEELRDSMIDRLWIKRFKQKKPTSCALTGKSGEGKSWSAIKFSETIANLSGYDFADYFRDAIMHTPLDFSEKIDKILYDKEYKDLNVVILDEASNLLNAREWQDYLAKATNKILNQSRRIKPLSVFLVTQFLKDLTVNTRQSLTYYGLCDRKNNQATVDLYETYENINHTDISRTKIGGRRFRGIFRNEYGDYVPFTFKRFYMPRPSKKITKQYEEDSYEAKAYMIRNDLENLMQKMREKYGKKEDKVSAIIQQWYEKPKLYDSMVETYYGKVLLNSKVKKMYSLTSEEMRELKSRIQDKLKNSKGDKK